ncbi:Dihydrolipoyllysine-residue acetyltransferase component of pyruvate dehydrogenase complex [Halioglobus japonicus]|nr:Dihydrolipoyllysine-residue acetyltransferase component of pyruvate dehydrogenase complex [Halioglobus japonicus]
MSVEQVTVPDIGGAEGAEVIELLVAVGDVVELDQSLIVLESDKASMEIPSTLAGTVVELLVAEGDQLAEGAPIVKIEVAGDAAKTESGDSEAPASSDEAKEPKAANSSDEDAAPDNKSAEDKTEPEVAKAAAQPSKADANKTPEPDGSGVADATAERSEEGEAIYAGPAVRKLARELGVQLGQVEGSGPQGRILKEDLQQYVKKAVAAPSAGVAGSAGLPAVPEMDFAKFGDVDVTQRSKLDKLTAANMQRSWLNVPHVTQFDDADITDLQAFRATLKHEAQRRETKLSPLPFILKACAVALRDNPKINSSLARGGEDLVYKQYIHIGMAVDTPAGLMVPVIRDVDRKTIWELAGEIVQLADKARERKLSPAEMQGGCFTVSSLGNIGGNGFTPIVNTPEVAILGVSKAAIKPVWNGSEFEPRTLLPLSLSYDHRVVNGGDGGRFFTQLVSLLGDIRQLSL